MTPKIETETHRKVFDNEHGWSCSVGPDGDGLGLVAVEGGDEFGRLTMPPEFALQVGEAILKSARELIAAAQPTGLTSHQTPLRRII